MPTERGRLATPAAATQAIVVACGARLRHVRVVTVAHMLPNVLLIVADDYPRNILASYGSQHGLTPHLDSLGQRGLTFTNAYTVAPLCTPSRYALLTGSYASRGARDRGETIGSVVRQVDFQVFLEHKKKTSPTQTIARLLHSIGFHTGFLGKYHVGHSLQPVDCAGEDAKVDRGKPSLVQQPFLRASLLSDPREHAALSCKTIGNQSCLAASIQRHAGFDHVADVYYDNNALTFYAHQPEWMAQEALHFIRASRARQQPFFLWMAPSLTHSPSDLVHQLQSEPRVAPAGCGGSGGSNVGDVEFLNAARTLRATVLNRLSKARLLCKRNQSEWRICPDEKLPRAAELLHPEPFLPTRWFDGNDKASEGRRAALATSVGQAAWLDASLAEVFQEIEANHAVSTLAIFTSDHGPYFAGKGHAYDAGIRVPLLMHWLNGPLAEARTVAARVTHLDVLPTLARLTGGIAGSGAIDGRDITFLMSGNTSYAPVDKPLIIEVGFSRTVVHNGYKLMLYLLPADIAADPSCRSIHGIAVQPVLAAADQAGNVSKVKFLYDVRERHPQHHCDRVQLYDLAADPAEQHNLAVEQPTRVESLRMILMDHIMTTQQRESSNSTSGAHNQAKVPVADATVGRGVVAASLPPQRDRPPLSVAGDGLPPQSRAKGKLLPLSWCQTCHPSSSCAAWPAESDSSPAFGISAPRLEESLAGVIRQHAKELVARMHDSASAHAVSQMINLEAASPYAPRDKCLLIRAHNGRLLIDFLRTPYGKQRDFSIASCFPSKKGNYLRSRLHVGLRLILRVLRRTPSLPDFEIGFCPDDCSPALSAAAHTILPALTSVSCAGRSTLPFVAWTVNSNRATDLSEWDAFVDEWAREARTVPWATRLPKAVFRGHLRPFTVCGGWPGPLPHYNQPINASNWRALGRSAIWAARIARPELLDVNFDNRNEMATLWKLKVSDLAEVDEPTSIGMEEQARRFRYAIHPEGQCGFADRLKTIMALPMLVIKQANPCAEWYEGMLVAGRHYAPVDGNYANLSEVIDWARMHDVDAQRIAALGHERIRQLTSVKGIYVYVDQLVRSYAAHYAARSAKAALPLSIVGKNYTHEFSCEYSGATTKCLLREIRL